MKQCLVTKCVERICATDTWRHGHYGVGESSAIAAEVFGIRREANWDSGGFGSVLADDGCDGPVCRTADESRTLTNQIYQPGPECRVEFALYSWGKRNQFSSAGGTAGWNEMGDGFVSEDIFFTLTNAIDPGFEGVVVG